MSTNLLPEIVPPLPSEDFEWRTAKEFYHRLFFKGADSGILVNGLEIGTYIISVGDHNIFETASLRQAQAAAQQLGWALRDKLPVPPEPIFTIEMADKS